MRDMKDHPLAQAARYLDARAEEHGNITKPLGDVGLDADDVIHVAMQRALRSVCASRGVAATEETCRAALAEVPELVNMVAAASMDGIAIGWKAWMLDADG